MNFEDLGRALSETVERGRIGTPVSLRMHLQLSDPQADLAAALASVMRMAEPVLATDGATLMARRDEDERQWNVLLNCIGGQTLLITVGRGSVERSGLHLLLIGNHGICRLEGAEAFDEKSLTIPADADRWRTWIEKSLREGAAVPRNGS